MIQGYFPNFSSICMPHFGHPAVPTANARGTRESVINSIKSSSFQFTHWLAVLMMSSTIALACGYFAAFSLAVATCSLVQSVRAFFSGQAVRRVAGGGLGELTPP